MTIAVRADELQKKEWPAIETRDAITIEWVSADESLNTIKADVYFDLLFDENDAGKNKYPEGSIVFVNAVCCTTKEIEGANIIRMNGWNSFLNKDIKEFAAADEAVKLKAVAVLNALGWKFIWAPDEPGMIAPRVISMIINEAYYGLQDGISTKEAIDTAMKLGTNYPYGPFEWAEKIGLKNIYRLLKKLAKQNERYTIAYLIEEELKNKEI